MFSCSAPNKHHPELSASDSLAIRQAKANGELVNEGFERCRRFVEGWLAHTDPKTGLIPRNLQKDSTIWNAKDAAADNYPFMVLTASLTDERLFGGKMLDMLNIEKHLTSRIGNLPDTYSFEKGGFDIPEPNLEDILFGSSEYIKDGLLPLTEWLGKSPWSERMIGILDDMWANAPIQTEFGDIVSTNKEVNGEMLQVLSRIYWMTGEQKYLDWAIRLGDYYLLGDNHPTRNFEVLRLRDHGCEIVSGLCELYATLSKAQPEKKKLYEPHIHEMLNRILAVGRNEDGLFYDAINPQTGEVVKSRIADNFGYSFNGFYTVYQVDSVEAYRTAVLNGLKVLKDKYRNFDWENGSSDGYADAIEGALNLYARENIQSVKDWINSEIQVMWAMQKGDGVIEGWHGDGNFARTTIMYCLWKSQGATVNPWRSDVKIGAEMNNGNLMLSMAVDANWSGILKFDTHRHKTIMNMPEDWPRINQFPEWFVPEPNSEYLLIDLHGNEVGSYNTKQLNTGIPFSQQKGATQYILKKINNSKI